MRISKEEEMNDMNNIFNKIIAEKFPRLRRDQHPAA
jgi:hypothetical protein